MNKNFTAFIAAMFMGAILIVFFGSYSIDKKSAFADVEAEKVIYLTFDDGPSDRVTPKILDVLKEENVKATFFIVGKNAKTRKELVNREVAEGHSVGVHSYSHKYDEIYYSTENLLNDIDKCNNVIKEITGATTALYRFPGGSFGLSDEIKYAVKEHGMRFVDWNASFCDSEIVNAEPNQLVQAAIRTVAYPKSIIMLAHDGTDKTATADALQDVIRHFKSKGYVFKKF